MELAVPPGVPWSARAGVVLDTVVTGAAVSTRVRGAVIDVDLAALACKSCSTAAHTDASQDHTRATCRAVSVQLHTNTRTQTQSRWERDIPLAHGKVVHLSTLFSQLSPVYPLGQSHE